MVAVSLSTLLIGAGALVAAAPAPEKRASSSCTFTDAASAIKGKTSCTTITLNNIAVPAGTTLDLTKLTTGTTVIFSGTTSFGYKEWEGPLISVSGTKITVKGASGHVIDGNGAKWWDGKGSNGGKTKPKFFYAHSMKQSTISALNVKNTPVQAFSINTATDLVLDHITIDNSAGDVTNGGHNTDAFDVGSSSGITISNANVKNQDDCLAINSGTNIHFVGGTCSGGHGLSIGSVGGRSNNVVDGVVIENSKILNSDNGVRIKTVSGATGKVNNVTYSGITLSNIAKYGIVIQQDYENGSPTGKPTTGVPITGLTVKGVVGAVTAKATPVYILCGSGSCSKWTWSGNKVTGGVKSTKCSNVPSPASC
ncbi:polygalacturonase [Dendryphion nanum]|uniref:endo-polygalacturonase n=1 Tax=Dendryphion nanum TaxID=256645 RepID=A0A9P9EFB9_9PLEO|nr:polygalacturonase [Dendryphion nanum]